MEPIEETHPSLEEFGWSEVHHEPDYKAVEKGLLNTEDVQEHTVDKAILLKYLDRFAMVGGPRGDCLGDYVEVSVLKSALGLNKND